MKKNIIIWGMVLVFALWLQGCDTGNGSGSDNTPIVCFGDSLTEGYGASQTGSVDKSKSYPAFLQQKVTVPVVNSGISGDTAGEAVGRVEKDVLSHNPQLVIILLGANDFFGGKPAAATKANLQSIINKAKSENCKIYLASFIGDFIWESGFIGTIPGLSGYRDLLEDYKKMYSSLVSENKDIGFISDIWQGVWGIHMSDPIHPNAEGYRRIAENIFAVIKPYLLENNLIK